MRIGINAHLLNKENSTIGNCIASLIKSLLEIDSDNEYVLYLPKDAELKDIGDYDIRRTRFPSRLRLVRVFWEHIFLPRFLVADNVDVFHSPGCILPPLVSIPSVITIYDLIALLYPSLCTRSNALYYRLFLPQGARRAQTIIAYSQNTKEDIVSCLGVNEDKITVIYPGVHKRFKILNNTMLLNKVRRKYLLPGRFILFVGNLEPTKNIVRLIDAFFKLKTERHIEHSLVIVGKKRWGYKDIFERAQKSSYGNEIIFTGYVLAEDLPAIYNLAELFVFPSMYEGFGLPPLEAMACGVPVITSNRGSLPEAGGDAAITVGPDNTAELAAAIFRVLTDKDLRRRQIARVLKRSKLFSWEEVAKETLKVYEQVYSKSRTT